MPAWAWHGASPIWLRPRPKQHARCQGHLLGAWSRRSEARGGGRDGVGPCSMGWGRVPWALGMSLVGRGMLLCRSPLRGHPLRGRFSSSKRVFQSRSGRWHAWASGVGVGRGRDGQLAERLQDGRRNARCRLSMPPTPQRLPAGSDGYPSPPIGRG